MFCLHFQLEAILYLGTNLMGKFTQSVKRIVQEVKEDGTQGKLFYSCFDFFKLINLGYSRF